VFNGIFTEFRFRLSRRRRRPRSGSSRRLDPVRTVVDLAKLVDHPPHHIAVTDA
jgi:hypothetical protein